MSKDEQQRIPDTTLIMPYIRDSCTEFSLGTKSLSGPHNPQILPRSHSLIATYRRSHSAFDPATLRRIPRPFYTVFRNTYPFIAQLM